MVLAHGNAPRSIGYRPIALLLSYTRKWRTEREARRWRSPERSEGEWCGCPRSGRHHEQGGGLAPRSVNRSCSERIGVSAPRMEDAAMLPIPRGGAGARRDRNGGVRARRKEFVARATGDFHRAGARARRRRTSRARARRAAPSIVATASPARCRPRSSTRRARRRKRKKSAASFAWNRRGRQGFRNQFRDGEALFPWLASSAGTRRSSSRPAPASGCGGGEFGSSP